MNILITNDDGIDSPGIVKLAKAAKEFGEVYVVAPDRQRSCISHSFTYGTPIRLTRYDFPVDGVHAFSCNGTPADAVRIGMTKIVPDKTDFVFAGINNGYNIAKDIQYSGTVAAAMEAASDGVQAIAFSQGFFDYVEDGYLSDNVDKYLDILIKECMNKPLGKNQIWNINFPACDMKDCKGIMRDCKVSTDNFYDDGYAEEVIEEGVIDYRVISRRNYEAQKGTDLAAIVDNYIAVGIVNNIG